METTGDVVPTQSTLLMKAKEASKLTGIPMATVYELASRGVIPSLKVRRSVWFSRQAILNWIADQTNGLPDANSR